jgi:hypothetical protein
MSSPTLLAEEMQASPHSNGEKTSNPVLGSVTIPTEAALCNAILKDRRLIFEKFSNEKQGRSRKTVDPTRNWPVP